MTQEGIVAIRLVLLVCVCVNHYEVVAKVYAF